MKVAIGSLNKAKNEAVKNVFNMVFEDNVYERVETTSGISAQPKSSDEAITGAINRARQALSSFPDFDYGVGLEGTVESNKYGMFLLGWVAIVNKSNSLNYGSSAAVMLPDDMRKRIESGEELGLVIKDLMKDNKNEIRHSGGANGLLTNGLYDRVREFEDATKCALSRFVASNYYKK